MRCKKCGASLRTGTRVCPHCGEKVVIERVGRSEFTWDTDDLPKPPAGKKKAENVSMSWGGNSGRVDNASERTENKPKQRFVWPDDPEDPLTRKMREKQAAAETASEKSGSKEADRAEKMKKVKEESSARFKWDHQEDDRDYHRGARVSGNFLDWGSDSRSSKPKAKRSAPLEMDFGGGKTAAGAGRNARRAAGSINNSNEEARPGKSGLKAGTRAVLADLEKDDWESTDYSFNKDDFRFTRPDLSSMNTERAAAEIKHSTEAEDVERSVFSEFRNIVDSEKLFDENLEKLSFLSEEEQEEVKAAQEKKERLSSAPQFAFNTIESEYDRYRQESGADKALTYEEKEAQLKKLQAERTEREERERRAMLEAEAMLDAEEAGIFDTAEPAEAEAPAPAAEAAPVQTPKAAEIAGGAAAAGAVAVNAVSDRKTKPNKKGNKEVEIKINEPSGTKVTVKTQEISIADIQDGLDVMDVKTREVDLTDLKKPAPTNVQVSVEVNGADNTSVEVTRRHDGATVVKTVDSSSSSTVVDDPNQVGGEAYTDERFWEHPTDESSRMTITDIFGPEARKIIDKLDKKPGKKKGDTEDTLMLDIDPEDIHLSEEQTRQLLLDEDPDDFIDEIPDIDLSNVNLMEDEEYEEDFDEDYEDEKEEVAEEATEEAAEAETEENGEAEEATAEAEDATETEEAGEATEAEETADETENEAEETGETEVAEAEATDAGETEETDEAEQAEAEEKAEEPAETEEADQTVDEGPEDAPKSDSETAEELSADLTGPLAVSAGLYEAAEEASVTKAEEPAAEEPAEIPEDPEFEAKPAGEIPEVSRSWNDQTEEAEAPAETEAAAEEIKAEAEEPEPEAGAGVAGAAVSGVMAAEAMAGAAVMTEILDDDEPEAGSIPAKVTEAVGGVAEEVREAAEAAETAAESAAEKAEEAVTEAAETAPEAVAEAVETAEEAVESAPISGEVSEEVETFLAEDNAAKAEKKKKKKKSEGGGGFSAPVKAIIAVLVVLLVLEFTVIGVKLFARDSQANVFIERVEQQFFALDDATGDSGFNL